jgi:hypothetical protein
VGQNGAFTPTIPNLAFTTRRGFGSIGAYG